MPLLLLRVLSLASLLAARGLACPPGGCPIEQPDARCSQHSQSCGACVTADGCGYCPGDGTCREGTSAGPDVGLCAAWSFRFCAGEPCHANIDCDACVMNPLCGWCETTQSCSLGTAHAPQQPATGAAQWGLKVWEEARPECPGAYSYGRCPA